MVLLRCPKFLRCLTADAPNFDRGHSLISLLLPLAALDSLPTSSRPTAPLVNLSLRTSDRCHWCGNPRPRPQSLLCVRGNRRSAASGRRSEAISRKCPDWRARRWAGCHGSAVTEGSPTAYLVTHHRGGVWSPRPAQALLHFRRGRYPHRPARPSAAPLVICHCETSSQTGRGNPSPLAPLYKGSCHPSG